MTRRLRSILWSALLALFVISTAHADPPTTTPTSQPTTLPHSAVNLDQILNDMGSDDVQVREQATSALSDLDPTDLPRLRKIVDTTTDVDLRIAAAAAVKRLEERALVSPSLITLHVKDAPATDVLNAIGAQVSFDLVSDNIDWLKDIKLTTDADHQPFWTVMKQLGPQWPVRVMTTTNDPDRMVLTNAGNNFFTDRSTVAGPFLICPISLQSHSMVDLLQPVPQATFRVITLQLAVMVEPKIHASRMNVVVKEAVDENGKSVAAVDPGGPMGMQMSTVSPQAMMMVRLNPPAGAGKLIARLNGLIRYRVPTRTRHIEQADLADGKEHSIDVNGRPIKVSMITNDKQYNVKLVMPMNVNIQDELSTAIVRDLTLLDSDGHPLYRRSSGQTMNGRNWEFNLAFAREGSSFGKPPRSVGEPAKLVWELAVESKDVESAFELVNIPLMQ